MTTQLNTFFHQLLEAALHGPRRLRIGRSDRLESLDDRTLADIGISRSDIPSIVAESRGLSGRTRRRIVAEPSHA